MNIYEYLELAKKLLWFDSDFLDHFYQKSPSSNDANAKIESKFRLAGRLWQGDDILIERNRKLGRFIENDRDANLDKLFLDFLREIDSDNIAELLKRLCTSTIYDHRNGNNRKSDDTQSLRFVANSDTLAFAIFLYDDFYNELVLAVSHGYPMKGTYDQGESWGDFCRRIARETLDRFKDKSAERNDEQEESETTEISNNLSRLRHLQELKKSGEISHLFHDAWFDIQYCMMLKKGDTIETGVDCNKILPGVVAYRPNKGITGKLLFPKNNRELERPVISSIFNEYEKEREKKKDNTQTYITHFDNRNDNISEDYWFCREWGEEFWPQEQFRNVVNSRRIKLFDTYNDLVNDSMVSFFKAQLADRVVSYRKRDEMTAGRQMSQGIFEELQFISSRQIGDFFGIPLRFCGESFGVLKIERIYADQESYKKQNKPIFCKTVIEELTVFAYVLSGLLYWKKYNCQKELMNAVYREEE